MLTLPDVIVPILSPCAMLFTNPIWQKAQLLLVGAILAPGQRTVAAALRVMGRSNMGRSNQDDYARYHEVLNRGVWSPRGAARILLLLLLRRRGAKIKPRGIYRDGVRSSRHQLVRASGLRWISWSTLDLSAVAGPRPLGRTVLGLAGTHDAGALVPVPPATGTPAQEDHQLGAADSHAAASLVAPSPAGAGGGQWATPSSTSSTAASPLRQPVTLIADCAWTRLCTRPRRPVNLGRMAGRR